MARVRIDIAEFVQHQHDTRSKVGFRVSLSEFPRHDTGRHWIFINLQKDALLGLQEVTFQTDDLKYMYCEFKGRLPEILTKWKIPFSIEE